MTIKIRDVLLKSIPYLLSIAGGITLFVLTKDNIHSPSVADLIDNIAASLLSIPIVFLLYDYSNYRISRKLNQNMATTMSQRVSLLLMGVIILIRQMLGIRGKITLNSINKMQNLSPTAIARDLKIKNEHVQTIHTYHNNLESLIYQYAKNNVGDASTIQILSGISLDLLRLINVHLYHGDKKKAAKYISDIISRTVDWMDSDAGATMNFNQILEQATETANTK